MQAVWQFIPPLREYYLIFNINLVKNPVLLQLFISILACQVCVFFLIFYERYDIYKVRIVDTVFHTGGLYG